MSVNELVTICTSEELVGRVHSALRDVHDFPKPGILFKDITPLLSNAGLVSDIVDSYVANAGDVTAVCGLESRGFLFGLPVAMKLGVPFIPVRKQGKLPWKTHQVAYELEYGNAIMEIHQDALGEQDRVLIVDDLLATGGSALAAAELIHKCGASIEKASFLIALETLGGVERLMDKGIPVHYFVHF